MSTAPLMTDSPLALLLDGANAAPKPAASCAHADPYARWHGFMTRVVLGNGVVAGVAQFLSQNVAPVWVDGRTPRRPGR
jgi:hypothetical protein